MGKKTRKKRLQCTQHEAKLFYLLYPTVGSKYSIIDYHKLDNKRPLLPIWNMFYLYVRWQKYWEPMGAMDKLLCHKEHKFKS